MKLRDWLTPKRIAAGSSLLAAVFVLAGFLVLRRPPRVAMERYAPAGSLAFVEIDSLTDVLDRLTATRAWRELAPVLGMSSQLKQVGFVTDLIGRAGLGPDEVVLAGRAQCAIIVTGLQSTAGETDEGPYVHLKPRFALVIETHMRPETAARLVRERASIVARRIFGELAAEEAGEYRGSHLLVFHGGSDRQLLASSAGSVIVLANRAEAMESVLDAIAGRADSLSKDTTLRQMRHEIDQGSSIFGYVTPNGIRKLVELWPVLVAGRADSESLSLFGDLIEHISEQARPALVYSLEFEGGGVTEKYLTVLQPGIAEALAQPLKPASGAGFESLPLVPRSAESVTLIQADRVGELPERILKQLTPNVDIVAGVALREFVINFRKQYGLAPSDSIGDAVNGEIALVSFGDGQPRAMLIRVNDRSGVQPALTRYLSHRGASTTSERQDETEIVVSSSEDRRAAAFVGDFLVLGTRDQILEIIRSRTQGDGMDTDERLKQILVSRPANASVVTYRPGTQAAGRFMVAISKLTRATGGSLELLERDSVRRALDRVPRAVSFTEFRNFGVYAETRSAVGNFSALASLIGSPDEE